MKYTLSTLALASAALMAVFSSSAQANDLPNLSTSQFHQCLDGLKNTSRFRGISNSTFEQYRPSEPDPTVIRSLNYQPEFKKDPWDYHASLVDAERVADGLRAKYEQADVLRRIEARYGVAPAHVLGVWGVESNFGQTLGKKDLFTSLATLSCFDRRQNYFRGELASALKIVQNGDIRAQDMTGSWAGAFGQTQFMPSTFLELAVDFDGDGRKDLVNSKADALASTANFLAKRGYRAGEPWGYEVKLNGYSGSSGRTNKRSISHWQNMGLTLPDGRPLPHNMASAGLLLPAGRQGPAFLVGKNFDTFYSYNASESYALAIAHLATLLETESTNTNFATPWPTDDPGISRQEAKEIQQGLINAGYDIGNVDGIIGDNTRRAIMDYQRKMGVPADGRAGQKFHRLIAQNTGNQAPITQNSAVQTPSVQSVAHNPVQNALPQSSTPSASRVIRTTQTISAPAPTSYRRVVNADGTISLVPAQ
ncbi:lytic transglycosylase [Moraxella caviae]|uniref:Lytic transglycosylase n=1 Tax=Moraxella caviae TaxID=34060 RepID=A0A1S9ZUJ3_9GAMM|nr:lytic murein transglycosylase [Moraxella caviae]OOR87063.1 lytic transglycosylase [Moraxella caviae]STZ13802.1 Membrane-bound lytic murein transglycosylase B precursor [Moraxella caviae]VEW10180.1 Membrane-bound lytic murein transglycosylase B precursor [Moraxella caviae]VEW10621.1 Membrane-bound lytic murein transglycosylase B precursor [Moraxella caviae]